MAGYVNITKGSGLSLGSSSFTAITELSREYFDKDSIKYIDEIYQAIDEGGMDMLILEDLETEGFQAFYKATKQAYSEVEKSGSKKIGNDILDLVLKSWSELISLLESDTRVTAD